MKIKRIIPCLDIKDGRVVKGVKFMDLQEVSSPVELGKLYSDSGADELAFYDVTASTEGRLLFTDLLKQVAEVIRVPLTVGGGISSIEDCDRVFGGGADKVSINSGAIKNPAIISDAARKYGSGSVVISVDIMMVDGAYKVFASGGMEDTGLDAIEWVKRCAELGAGEFVINSIDADGVKNGYNLDMLKTVCDAVPVPVIASGGAGSIAHFVELFRKVPKIDAGLAASVFHFREIDIAELKRELSANGINVRL